MSQGLPTALILGIDHFVAKKLAEELVNKDIRVVGVGEMVSGLMELDNFSWAMDLDEVEGEFNYVFDFVGNKDDWQKIKGEKLALIAVDDESRRSYLAREAAVLDKDWRIIEAKGVYGERMGENGFLAKVIRQAVMNKNLELPNPDEEIRLLAIADLVEAILRACFLSGTNREYFLVLGKRISFEDLAKVLMDKAKMTRFKVMEKDISVDMGDERLAEMTEKQLRWKAGIDFDEGVEETLQYFFSKIDEENRQKKTKESEVKKKPPIEKINHRAFEVLVDEGEEINIVPKITEEVSNQNEERFTDSEDVTSMTVYGEEDELIEEEENDFELPSLMKPNVVIKENEFEEKESEDWLEEESEEFDEKKKNVFLPKVEDKHEVKVEKKDNFLKKNRELKKKLRFWWVGVLLVVIVAVAEPTKWFWTTWQATKTIKEIPELIKTKKYNQAEKLADNRINQLTAIDEKVSDWGLNSLKTMRNYQTGLKALVDVLSLEKGLPEVARSADAINEAMFNDKEINWSEELGDLEDGLNDTENNLGILQARLSGDYSWLPANWKAEVQKGLIMAGEYKTQVDQGREVIKLAPEILGLDGKQRDYMILFQNDSELRPTGGFIGSYGILSFKGGKLINLEIKDIYEADGQLKGHVEPPWEIKKHLGEANWFMRDANWKADFVKSAADIQWFLEKETGKKVNGVIGIDLEVAKAMLKATGEIYVPDFKEKINDGNLYEQAEFYAETKFFPGSTQKASFLGALGKQLFEEVKSLNAEKRLVLVQSFLNLLETNDLQLAINETETAKRLMDLNWDGRVYNGKCSGENCVMDYWYAVEANVGVNKANYFVKRSMEESTEITTTSINRILKINYENTAKNSEWPGGDYKNYMRLYLPKDVDVSQISVMDGNDTSIKKVYGSDEITIREVDGKKEVGFLVMVPVLKKRILEIRYSSQVDNSGKTFTYMKYIQKQPGTGETGIVSLITFPDNWQPLQVEPAASLVGGKLLFNQKLDEDIKMGVVLGK
jgi:nucleoside-diphosphate-sugar epimerase